MEPGEHGLVREVMLHGFSDAEVDDLGHGFAIDEAHHHVGWFDIPMHQALLVGVLDGTTDGDEQFQPLGG